MQTIKSPAPVPVDTANAVIVPRSQIDRAPTPVPVNTDPGVIGGGTPVPVTPPVVEQPVPATPVIAEPNIPVTQPVYLKVDDEGTIVVDRTTVINFVGNGVSVVKTGGSTATVTITTGGGGSNYGNANVATFMASFGSNVISTSGNVTAGRVFGNLQAPDGNGSVLINVDGVIGAAPGFSYDRAANALFAPTITATGHPETGVDAFYGGIGGYVVLGSSVIAQLTSNVNGYSQINQQNINSGTLASADYIITADNGTDSTYYLDIGLASSTHDDPDFFGDTSTANDGYLYVTGADQAGPSNIAGPGNLIIGSTNGVIKMFVGNTAQANVIATVSSTGVSVAGNVTAGNMRTTGGSLSWANASVVQTSTSNFSITGDGQVTVRSLDGTYQWTFGSDGNLAIPGNIIGAATIDIDNRASGNSADINLYSADDITLQARDRTLGSFSEGGDINIFAGDSAEDGDSSGGDVTIEAGRGGAANVDFGGSGGTIRIEAGQGGDASTGVGDYSARSGGSLTLRAGDAGSDMGNIARGASGGAVYIESGYSTGNTNSGGDIFLNTATGGQNGTSGAVVIDIPSYGNTTGGIWRFNPNGSTIYPNLTVTRGDRTGTLTGQTLLFGDSTQEAIISTPNGTSDINSSQRLVINPGAGYANTTGEGGDIYLYAGRGGDAGGSGGDIKIRGGLGPVNGAGGYIDIIGGEADADGVGGRIDIQGGQSGNSNGGDINITGGQGIAGGDANITGGVSTAGPGGPVNITGGTSSNGLAEYGNVNITSGASTWTFDNTGNLTIIHGSKIAEVASPVPGNYALALSGTGMIDADQQLLVYPTSMDANHLHLTSGNLYNTELFLGNDNLYVKLANTGNVIINTDDSVGNSAQWTFGANGVVYFPRDAAGNTDPILTIAGGANPRILSEDASLAGPANLEITALNTVFTGSTGQKVTIYPDDGEIAGDANIQIWANAVGNTQYSWTFGDDGNLTTSSNLVIGPTGLGTGTGFTQSDAPLLLGSSEANGKASLIWYENPTGPGNVVQVGLNDSTPGSMTVTTGDFSATTYVWDFDNTGNLTLPTGGNIYYANGNIYGGGGGSSYGNANVADFLDSLGSNAIVTTGNITGGNVIATANVLGNGHARLTGSFDESQASTAGLYLGYAGGTPRIMFGTGNTSQTLEIDNDGGTLRFYKPGTTLASLTSGGALSVLGNITGANILTAGSISAAGNVTAANFVGNISITGNVTGTTANVTLVAGSFSTVFDNTGKATFPGSMITTPVPLANLIAVAGARAFVNNANLVATGNFGSQISGGGSNTVPVWSDGSNWYIG